MTKIPTRNDQHTLALTRSRETLAYLTGRMGRATRAQAHDRATFLWKKKSGAQALVVYDLATDSMFEVPTVDAGWLDRKPFRGSYGDLEPAAAISETRVTGAVNVATGKPIDDRLLKAVRSAQEEMDARRDAEFPTTDAPPFVPQPCVPPSMEPGEHLEGQKAWAAWDPKDPYANADPHLASESEPPKTGREVLVLYLRPETGERNVVRVARYCAGLWHVDGTFNVDKAWIVDWCEVPFWDKIKAAAPTNWDMASLKAPE